MTRETTEITDSLEALTVLYDTLHAEQDELSSDEILQICKTISNSAYIIQLLQRLGGIYLTELEEENLTDIVDLTTGIVSTIEGLYEDE
tara:strand:- start:1162 stop:1428 length:267 start_codon:yes stop_codon:yes gene_type:complete